LRKKAKKVTQDQAQKFDAGVALLAGGSGGIGSAIARGLVAAGSDVVFTYYRNQAAAMRLRDELAASGRRVEAIQLALEDAGAVAARLADIRARYERIHSVIYASGPITPINFVGALSTEEWVKTFEHDTHACFHLVNAVLPILKAQKGGSITAVTTTQYARHVPMSVLSSAPKAAIESMLQVAAREYGRYGIRANSVRSGWLDGGKFADGIGGQVTDKAKQAIVATIPLGALGDPADVADAVVFLSSRQARYITGEALSVDGGWKL
jgi:NAD(P)-dependent dehydrogenase (short-subunit alcohol dehydrogenase family)